ncbi:MAG: ABC transporter substrate-binding protein [Chloroflexi bacterium]|nr:ABC transporter substrate-binding protein [Chloroflexota bacterium]MBI3732698.1 ABC transporter substrate-binding protein [Chloroflexota bacterium]
MLLTGPVPQFTTLVDAFRQGLKELGYVEGQNIAFEYRYAESQPERLRLLVSELVAVPVDVMVIGNTRALQAALQTTSAVPIVAPLLSDPEGDGCVFGSIAHPDKNCTGLSTQAPGLSAKRVDFLKDAFPAITRLAIIWNPANPSSSEVFAETENAARRRGLQVLSLNVQRAQDFTFASAADERFDAVITLEDVIITVNSNAVFDFVAQRRVPAIYPSELFSRARGLMSYGPPFTGQYKRAATYVDRLLKGEKPANLPVSQPTEFVLIVNLKAANTLGLTISADLLSRADEVIQ